jgi:hypothetical protein
MKYLPIVFMVRLVGGTGGESKIRLECGEQNVTQTTTSAISRITLILSLIARYENFVH